MTLGFYWDEVPRAFGNPEQTMVFDKKYLAKLIRDNDGVRPCFISHNSFKLSVYGFPSEVRVSKIFSDLDSERKPENAHLDARRLCRFARELNLPMAFAYSAGKGFHPYLLLEPQNYPVNQKLKDAIRAVQLFLRGLGYEDSDNQEYKMNLRTYDPRILGDERRLCRVWMSKYVSGKKKHGEYLKLDTHCCPLTEDMLLNWNIGKIKEYSKNPEPVKFDFKGKVTLTLKEFIKKFEIKKPTSYLLKPETAVDGRIVEFKGIADDYLLNLFPDRPCIAEAICQENPPHEARFSAVTYMVNRLEMNREQIFQLFKSRNWVDNDNIDRCKYQIKQICEKKYYVPSCEKLRMNNLCLGTEKCQEIRSKIQANIKNYNPEEWS